MHGISTSELAVGTDKDVAADRKGWMATGLSLIGALAMTSCCILPLVLVSFGVTGVFIAQLSALYAYKWITLTISAAFLSYGFWKAYRPVSDANCAGGACARPIDRTVMRVILWIAATIVAAAAVFPYLVPLVLNF